MSFQYFLGMFAGLLLIPTTIVYIRSILQGETKPNRVTWWILALITVVVVLSSYSAGARETLWLPVAYALGYICIGIFSIRYGDGPFTLSTLDRVALVGGIASAIAYVIAQSPLVALFLSALSEFIALTPTAVKSYTNPETESRTAWIIGTTASFINLLAIGTWSLGIAAYPIWIFLSNLIIVYFLIRTRRPVAESVVHTV